MVSTACLARVHTSHTCVSAIRSSRSAPNRATSVAAEQRCSSGSRLPQHCTASWRSGCGSVGTLVAVAGSVAAADDVVAAAAVDAGAEVEGDEKEEGEEWGKEEQEEGCLLFR